MARPDPARVNSAKIAGLAKALHDFVITNQNRNDFCRKDWPELWERIDDLVELVKPPSTPRS